MPICYFFIVLENCIPYSEKACLDVARRSCFNQGANGKPFSSNYDSKGCHVVKTGKYANTAFYGTGGTEEEMKSALMSPEYRPKGYNCAEIGKNIKIFWVSNVIR